MKLWLWLLSKPIKFNLNSWATRLTLREGGKKEISVAQVKEVLRLVMEDVAMMDEKELRRLLKRLKEYRK
jgi:hypothetical protein